MPVQETVDEESPVGTSRAASRGVASRPVHEDVVENGAVAAADRGEDDEISDRAPRGPKLKTSTQKILKAIEKNVAHADITDDDLDPDDVGTEAEHAGEPVDPDDVGTEAVPGAQVAGAAPGVVEEKPGADDEIRATVVRLETTNRKLLEENETLKKQPRTAEIPERLTKLAAAEQMYVDEGPLAAYRHFVSIVLDAAPDSKEVDAEVAGFYTELTAKELGVPLDASHQAVREAARTRLALARDKRERKAEADAKAKPEVKQDAPDIAPEVVTFIDNRLSTKPEGKTSIADEHPLLMVGAKQLDGMEPSELLARVMKRDLNAGVLDPSLDNDTMIRITAKRIESYYNGLYEMFSKVKTPAPKTDTSKSGDTKSATASQANPEQRQNAETRTISNKAAGRAPATPPKQQQPAKPGVAPMKFKSKKERDDYFINKHFPK